MTSNSPTSITISWQPPPKKERHGIIKGFKLYYRERSSEGTTTIVTINSEVTLSKVVHGLFKYTEYEFQVSAFTSVGDGPKSVVNIERTKEDGKRPHTD